jgi:hypothetical protein
MAWSQPRTLPVAHERAGMNRCRAASATRRDAEGTMAHAGSDDRGTLGE